eukprot:GGOE01034162.1.p1 GENE.GGOE01034162.1~~GGOE01034162.1.p1  ORF type:complete len:859 (-),score=122.20 GGOE01034162.1:328-2904(-)
MSREPTITKRTKRKDDNLSPQQSIAVVSATPQSQRFQAVPVNPQPSNGHIQTMDPRPLTGTLCQKRSPMTGTRTVLERRRPYTTGDTPAVDSPQLLQMILPAVHPKMNNLVTQQSQLEHFAPSAIPVVEGVIDYDARLHQNDNEYPCASCMPNEALGPNCPTPICATSPERPKHILGVGAEGQLASHNLPTSLIEPPTVCESPIHKKQGSSFRNPPPPVVSSPVTYHSPMKEGSGEDTTYNSPQQVRRQTPSQIHKTTRVRMNNRKVLGKGTWGTVYVGLNEATRELIAVKEVMFTSKEEVEQCAREIRVMKNLNHPNIVKYLGAERDENTLKIYMEFIVGGSLAGLIKNYGALTELMAQGYCIQILEGLVYLHDKNIAHRDIKCDNLLVEKNGDVKLADFGQSKDASEILKTVTGTAYFMAPEVIKGEEYTLMADIWSFGCSVIEMLAGNPPFSHHENQWAAMYHITNSDPSLEIPKGCSTKATSFLNCCLCLVPQERWPAYKLLGHGFLAARRESIDAIRQSATTLQLHLSQMGPFGLGAQALARPDSRPPSPPTLLPEVTSPGAGSPSQQCQSNSKTPSSSNHVMKKKGLLDGHAESPTKCGLYADIISRLQDDAEFDLVPLALAPDRLGSPPDAADPAGTPDQKRAKEKRREKDKKRGADLNPLAQCEGVTSPQSAVKVPPGDDVKPCPSALHVAQFGEKPRKKAEGSSLCRAKANVNPPKSPPERELEEGNDPVMPMIISRNNSEPDVVGRRTPTGVRPRVSAGQVLGNIRGGSAGKTNGKVSPHSDAKSPASHERPLPPLCPQDSPPHSPPQQVGPQGGLPPQHPTAKPRGSAKDELDGQNPMQSYTTEPGD